MFKSIAYKNAIGPGPLIDIGALAEGLLFYERVAIIGNSATLDYLLQKIPPFVLLSLLKDGRLEIYYLTDQLAVTTHPPSSKRLTHNLITVSSPDHTIEKVAPNIFRKKAGNTSQSKLGAKQFMRLIQPIDHSGFDQKSLLQLVTDAPSTQSSVISLIQEVAPSFELPPDTYFRAERENDSLHIDTNLNLEEINKVYHQKVSPTHSSLTEAYLLALIQGAYETTYFAAKVNSEIAVHPVERQIQAKSLQAIALRNQHSQSQIESFSDLTLSDSRAIREVINSGAVPFSSVIKLLESADKFRHWLHSQPIDTNLLRAYYQETVKESWVDKLPAKSTRWSIFTGIGLGLDGLGTGGIGTAAGVALSAVDAFVLDKLIKGWKPHQFIEHDLKSFLTEQSE